MSTILWIIFVFALLAMVFTLGSLLLGAAAVFFSLFFGFIVLMFKLWPIWLLVGIAYVIHRMFK